MTYMITTARAGSGYSNRRPVGFTSDSILADGIRTLKLARRLAYDMVTSSNRYRLKEDRVTICQSKGQLGRVSADANVYAYNGAVLCESQRGSVGVFGLNPDGSMYHFEGRRPSAVRYFVHPYLTGDAYGDYAEGKMEEALDRYLARLEDGDW